MMKTRQLALIALLIFALSCNTITQGFSAPTSTPLPTLTAVPSETATPADTATPTATAVPPTETEAPPAYVPPGCENIPPATVPAATALAVPTESLQANPPIASDEQLRVFDKVVAKINQVYLYPDFNGRDWPGIVAAYRGRVEAGLGTEAFYTEMEMLVLELGDEHSVFESPVVKAASDAELAGSTEFVGIGVIVKPFPERGRVTVLVVFPDSPAFYGGLRAHDSILAVDGTPIVQDGVAYPHLVRGPECTAVVATVQSPGEQPRRVTFVRKRVIASEPIDARLVPTADGSRIGYIFLPTFYNETIPGQVEKALQDFGPLDGLILDNRMNSGGSSDVVYPILGFFTSGTLGHYVSRTSRRPLAVKANPIQNSQTVPLVILVGKDTVSFGEIFSGLLQDTGRALLAGETTLGNVETLQGYNFEDGSRIWIAEERFDPEVSHANWEQDGIKPDVTAAADWDTFTFETDPGVAAAVQLLGHR